MHLGTTSAFSFGRRVLERWHGLKSRLGHRLDDLHCSWLGHVCEYYVGGHYVDRHGRSHAKYYGRCRRCGCGGGACYEPGWIERIARAWRDFRWRLGARLWADCRDCHKPQTRLGIAVGRHEDCLPF